MSGRPDYSRMDDERLVNEHERVLRIQRRELDAGNTDAARSAAECRQAMWEEAESRGIEDRLL